MGADCSTTPSATATPSKKHITTSTQKVAVCCYQKIHRLPKAWQTHHTHSLTHTHELKQQQAQDCTAPLGGATDPVAPTHTTTHICTHPHTSWSADRLLLHPHHHPLTMLHHAQVAVQSLTAATTHTHTRPHTGTHTHAGTDAASCHQVREQKANQHTTLGQKATIPHLCGRYCSPGATQAPTALCEAVGDA